MREILFRGKRIDNGKWRIGFYCQVADESDGGARVKHVIVVPTFKTQTGFLVYEVIPSTVGQYTGLTDKNGKKIFEGDILKEDDVLHNGETQIKGRIGTCSFEKGCWVILFKDTWGFLQTNIKACSVIGNIHDNPELLKSRS